MTTRREFLLTGGLAALGAGRVLAQDAENPGRPLPAEIIDDDALPARRPVVVSTWNHGLAANAAAWKTLAAGGSALDAVEAGVRVTEADPDVTSVGYGGLPDADGVVTLDASIMEGTGRAGAVAFLRDVLHPVSVAREVMEATPHVMLVGEGAHRFAVERGFPTQDLLTPQARAAWEEWRAVRAPAPDVSPDNHDTIGMVALDAGGRLAGACTTSGAAFKRHGRVGDSPIIGAALFVDDAVGGATATGLGEEVMKTVGGFLVVELMRQGASPQEACEAALARIARRHGGDPDVQVGYVALDRRGRVGAAALQPGFQAAVADRAGGARLLDAVRVGG